MRRRRARSHIIAGQSREEHWNAIRPEAHSVKALERLPRAFLARRALDAPSRGASRLACVRIAIAGATAAVHHASSRPRGNELASVCARTLTDAARAALYGLRAHGRQGIGGDGWLAAALGPVALTGTRTLAHSSFDEGQAVGGAALAEKEGSLMRKPFSSLLVAGVRAGDRCGPRRRRRAVHAVRQSGRLQRGHPQRARQRRRAGASARSAHDAPCAGRAARVHDDARSNPRAVAERGKRAVSSSGPDALRRRPRSRERARLHDAITWAGTSHERRERRCDQAVPATRRPARTRCRFG